MKGERVAPCVAETVGGGAHVTLDEEGSGDPLGEAQDLLLEDQLLEMGELLQLDRVHQISDK